MFLEMFNGKEGGETAMSTAFEKAGFLPRQMKLYKPLKEFFSAGGTIAELMAVAEELNGSDGGLSFNAGNSHRAVAPALPANASGDGQGLDAEKAIADAPRPARSPSAAQLSAAATVASKIALSAFERELTHTGRQWGNVTYRELDSLSDDGSVAAAIKTHIGSIRGDERNKKISELMTAREFMAVLRKFRGGK